ncbi:MAG: T9SS type A sorting domain-containing protein, partial [Rhodothermaceae bacterium]|nr:T9SS type A sorting domain-containing protein [Rhodothermaceae bacterium]
GYTNAELTMMVTHYTTQGYSVTMPTPTANEANGPDEQVASFELTAAYPNPFGPAANFTLRVAEAQHVSVALFDALGRQVQVLYEGPMAAGERRVLTIEADNLPSGLYIYRAVGEGVSASQRVVLNK